METTTGRDVHLDEWVGPTLCDERGYLRAGKVLEWMDVIGVLAATRHCRRPVVTASVDGMHLEEPVRLGDRVTMTATVAHTSERSIGVSVELSIGIPNARRGRRSLTGYMTFVALDEQGRPVEVPQFRPETKNEQARFREGHLRREFRKKLSEGKLTPARHLDVEAGTEQEQRILIGELLKVLPVKLRLPWEREGRLAHRAPHHSYVHKIEPVRVNNLNFHGTLYGGTLMRWLETSSALSASAYLDGGAVVFTGLQGLTFIRPVQQHVFVHIRSIVAHTSSESLTVLVTASAEDPVGGTDIETLRAFLTYSPEKGKAIAPQRIAPLQTSSDEERALFEEVEHRLVLQRTLIAGAKHEVGEASWP
ncbi:MAG: acyl-CoA thioesterase [Myxococcaceae bacterium]